MNTKTSLFTITLSFISFFIVTTGTTASSTLPDKTAIMQKTERTVSFIMPEKTTISHINRIFTKPQREKFQLLSDKKHPLNNQLRNTREPKEVTIYQVWDGSVTNDWLNYSKETVIHNVVENPQTYTIAFWQTDKWFDTLKTTYIYNATNEPTQIASVLWVADSATFVNFENASYTYSHNRSDLTEYLKQNNFPLLGSTFAAPMKLLDSTRTTSTYDSNGTVLQDIIDIIDTTTAPFALLKDSRISYSYNTDLTLKEALFETWDDTNWVNLVKFNESYESTSGNHIEELLEIWNPTTSVWENYARYTYAYAANDSLTHDLYEEWVAQGWEGLEQYFYTYDVSENLSTVEHQEFDSVWIEREKYNFQYGANGLMSTMVLQTYATNTWVDYIRARLTYNSTDLPTEEKYEEWINSISTWINLERYLYTYSTAINSKFNSTSSNTKIVNISHCITSTKNVRIQFTLAQPAKVSLQVFDLRGNLVTTLGNDRKLAAGTHNLIWDKTNRNGIPLASGMYLYQMKVNNFVVTRQFQLVK